MVRPLQSAAPPNNYAQSAVLAPSGFRFPDLAGEQEHAIQPDHPDNNDDCGIVLYLTYRADRPRCVEHNAQPSCRLWVAIWQKTRDRLLTVVLSPSMFWVYAEKQKDELNI